mmetsp:Transcript_63919/g.207766  ORF Transcript_63919/g.207766 Transcript_63919/m.207766 type:complete len:343 (-) Transcript_63919:1120-2148(-)
MEFLDRVQGAGKVQHRSSPAVLATEKLRQAITICCGRHEQDLQVAVLLQCVRPHDGQQDVVEDGTVVHLVDNQVCAGHIALKELDYGDGGRLVNQMCPARLHLRRASDAIADLLSDRTPTNICQTLRERCRTDATRLSADNTFWAQQVQVLEHHPWNTCGFAGASAGLDDDDRMCSHSSQNIVLVAVNQKLSFVVGEEPSAWRPQATLPTFDQRACCSEFLACAPDIYLQNGPRRQRCIEPSPHLCKAKRLEVLLDLLKGSIFAHIPDDEGLGAQVRCGRAVEDGQDMPIYAQLLEGAKKRDAQRLHAFACMSQGEARLDAGSRILHNQGTRTRELQQPAEE